MEEETAKLIRRGERLREILKQPRFHPFSMQDQVASLIILNTGVLDSVETTSAGNLCEGILKKIKAALPELMERIGRGETIGGSDMETMRTFIMKAGG